MTQVRRAIAGDERVLRDLRLQALAESPDAFGSTYEREFARTAEDWQRWLSPGVTFILETQDGPRGLVAGVHDPSLRDVVHLMAMWVHPKCRGTGAAAALVEAVVSWAAAETARVIRLAVVETNQRAWRFYERTGFTVVGRAPSRDREGTIHVEMERRLGRDGSDE
jgi:ribosomal protein S18 acetylase RimI-like enzyme